jgi:hypothetical protein
MARREGETIQRIRRAICAKELPPEFRASDVNRLLGIHWGGNFLAKHRQGGPRGTTAHFARITRGLYRLRDPV